VRERGGVRVPVAWARRNYAGKVVPAVNGPWWSKGGRHRDRWRESTSRARLFSSSAGAVQMSL